MKPTQFIFSIHCITEYYSQIFEIGIKNNTPLLGFQCGALAHICQKRILGRAVSSFWWEAHGCSMKSFPSALVFKSSFLCICKHKCVHMCVHARECSCTTYIVPSHLGLLKAMRRALVWNRRRLWPHRGKSIFYRHEFPSLTHFQTTYWVPTLGFLQGSVFIESTIRKYQHFTKGW